MIWLQAQGGGLGSLGPLIPMLLIFVIFYFLLIRPQQKKQKDHEKMLGDIGRGDQVVTAGGIHGQVTAAEESVLTLEIANLKGERLRVKVDRARVDRVVEKAKGTSK